MSDMKMPDWFLELEKEIGSMLIRTGARGPFKDMFRATNLVRKAAERAHFTVSTCTKKDINDCKIVECRTARESFCCPCRVGGFDFVSGRAKEVLDTWYQNSIYNVIHYGC